MNGGVFLIKKYLSWLSLVFLILSFIPIFVLLFTNTEFFAFGLEGKIGLFVLPIPALIGLISGILGVKGNVRFYLIFLNISSILFYIVLIFIAVYGFQEP